MDYAQQEREYRALRIKAAIFAPVPESPENAAQLIKDLKSDDRETVKKAQDHISKSVSTVLDVFSGRPNAILEDGVKMVVSSYLPMQERILATFTTFGNELTDFDMTWMDCMVVDPLLGENKASIYHVVNSTVAHELPSPTHPIPASQFNDSYWSTIRPRFFGVKVPVANYVMESDPLTTLNAIVVACRIALLKKKTSVVFEYINAGIDAANTATYVTNYIGSSIARTINQARRTLINRLANKGYGVSRSTPVVLYANPALEDQIEAVYAITVNSLIASGNNNGTITVNRANSVQRIYTENIAQDLDLGGVDSVALIVPGILNRVGQFRAEKMQSGADLETDSMTVYGRESYAATFDETQVQIAKIA